MEGDCTPYAQPTLIVLFQSTPSAWRETRTGTRRRTGTRHFNPLPPHGGRPLHSIDLRQVCNISIHSLRMEGDPISCIRWAYRPHFNPLPPHGGRPVCPHVFLLSDIFQSTPSAWRETIVIIFIIAAGIFQSTPSAWRETKEPAQEITEIRDFNPLPPHGGRRAFHKGSGCIRTISIHSLRMEGDRAEVRA